MARSRDDRPPRHALVIRFRRVGDSVLGVAVCTSLKRTFPGIRVDYVLNAAIAPLYEGHSDIDRVIPFTDDDNRHALRYIARVHRVMRRTRYDIIIDMRATVRTLLFSLFSLRTPFRIGTRKAYSRLLHNYRVADRTAPARDMVQRDLMLLQPLERIANVIYDPCFRLHVPDEERRAYRAYMERCGIDFTRPIVLAAVATRIVGKGWDMERMQAVLRRMIDTYHPQIIFNYSGDRERALCLSLYERMGRDAHLFPSIEAATLRDLRALTSLCHFFFGNEGGPRHIAQALDIPAYAIYPPGVSKRLWLPGDSPRFRGISPDDIAPPSPEATRAERFDLLTVDRVWQGVDEMMREYAAFGCR